MNKFRAWILATGGKESLAERMGKSPRAIYKWMSAETAPTGKDLVELRKLGKGAFTIDDVIDCCVLNKK